MEFSIKAFSPEKKKTGCLVLGVWQGAVLTHAAQAADKASGGQLSRVLKGGDLSGRNGTTLLLHAVKGIAADRLLLVGLGEQKEFGETAFRDAIRATANALKGVGASEAILAFADAKVPGRDLAWNVRHVITVVREIFYRFDTLKTQKKAPLPKLASITLAIDGTSVPAPAQGALKEASATSDGIDLAKTLGNMPPNICTPAYLADEARKVAREFKLGFEVLDQRDLEKLGMGAMLAVSRGSHQPPKLIVMKYMGGPKKQKPIVYVGKGITFDTGGISLKPAAEMDEMKFDMSGAGSVIGTMRALAGMRAPVNVIGLVAACENMPGGNATRPGDVVTTLSGQTVEILNTDAEGRLVLCDALTYAERFEPDVVIDIATLTGACVVALGHIASGLFANDEKLAGEVGLAAADAWDRVWQLPLWDDYQEGLRSNFADMANIGGRPGGSITAACFLSRFAKKFRWAHLDVAGTAWRSGRDKGSSGRPVPLLTRFALRHAGVKLH